jgi:RNA polymerase sigma-70 factor, ECF subfamily
VNGQALERVFRSASGRIIGALAGRFRNLDLAEEAFAEACSRAVEGWPLRGTPRDPPAWLYRVADRIALDGLRRARIRQHYVPEVAADDDNAEQALIADSRCIPDDRLRLIFICCHPSVAPEARAALTLRLVCGLTVTEIARAFLVAEPTLAQRLVRAKRKIADAGVPFELPRADLWPERMEAVLSTLEVAYAKAHEDAAGTGRHGGYALEMLQLSKLLVELVPHSSDAYALAATLCLAEARRPARVDESGMMIPLSEQDPMRFRNDLIDAGAFFLRQAEALDPSGARILQATLQGVWCARKSLSEPAPWPLVLALYDRLLIVRDDPIVRLNRAVALSKVAGPEAALAELAALGDEQLAQFAPYQAVRADCLARVGKIDAARAAYASVLALEPAPAERLWLERELRRLDCDPKVLG